MKKVLSIFMFGFMLFLGLSFTTQVKAADEEIIDLYPYDQEACLLMDSSCTGTKVGDSHWTFTYIGNRYHVIKDLVRYGSEMIDDNSDGWIDDSELAGIPYNAFASVFMNNTDSEIDILTTNARTDITDVVHRMYAHFDENGVLQMFEDHISFYYIHNDGDALTPDWRLATQAETDAYKAEVTAGTITDGNPSTDGLTRNTRIRIALSDTDSDGYVVEPLGYLKWTNADVDTLTAPVEDWSTIIAGDPNNLYIPAGWTVVSFGTNDRGTINAKTTAFIKSLPAAMVDSLTAPMFMTYTDQPGWFDGVLALDDDAATPGVNVVVDYETTFNMPATISASWVNMFDDLGNVIHSTDKLDYSVGIYQDETLLETIDYTWNTGTSTYDASAEQTVIDTSEFGTIYNLVYTTETPSNDITTQNVDVVIGVMPPKFTGVVDRYSDEGVYIDLLEGITADDGYDNDLTDTIQVTAPDGFNYYSPKPGAYEIGLAFTHHVHFDGVDPFIVLNGTEFLFDGSTNIISPDWDSVIAVYTEVAPLQATTMSWGSSGVLIEVDGTGHVIRTIDRHNWDLVDINGLNTPANASGMFDAWLAGLTLEENGFIIIVGYNMGATYTAAKALVYGDPVSYDLTQKDDFDYDIVTETSYTLTIDDTTAPFALVVDDNYKIPQGGFDSVNEAILANVVAFDTFDQASDLAVYVSDNGGLLLDTPGVYTVEVTVEDLAGNSAVASFDVEVLAVTPPLTEDDVQGMIDASTLTEADIQAMFDDQTLTAEEIQALLDAQVLTQEDIQDLIDASINGQDLLTQAEVQAMIDASLAAQPTGCGSSGAILPAFEIGGAFVLLGAMFVAFRKRS